MGQLLGATVLFANPSPDVYGSDLQMLESVSALQRDGCRVVVAVPDDGPLVAKLRDRGAEVDFVSFPVLRRANQSAKAFAVMFAAAMVAVPRLIRYVRKLGPDALYVNTVTLPWWLLTGRLLRLPTVAHLHEAESTGSGLVRRALVSPLRLAKVIIVISESAMQAMVAADPGLRSRARLIRNGVPAPPTEPRRPTRSQPIRAIVVGRLAPRKAPHLAIEAVAQLRRRGYAVELELAGTPFPGYEWYEQELRRRARREDLDGAVDFAGYCSPIWPRLAAADLMIAPSLREPFGNAVVEAQLSLRPVVATAALGHLESITDERTGLLVPAGDVDAMAAAVARLIDEPEFAERLADAASESARARFSPARYEEEVVAVVADLLGLPAVSRRR